MMLGSENGQIPTDEERGIDKEIEDEVFLIENKIIFKKKFRMKSCSIGAMQSKTR